MIEQTVELGGLPRTIYTAERAQEPEDLAVGVKKMMEEGGPIAFDIETNARSMYGDRFKVRLVQFGNEHVAYNFPVEKKWGGRHKVARILREAPALIAHSGKYDVLGLQVAGFMKNIEMMEGRYVDTRVLAHMADPRRKDQGGTGHALKDLVNRYVDDEFKDSAKELHAHFKKLFGRDCTIAQGFRRIDLFDPFYLQYAGLDVIGTALLYDVIAPIVRSQQS